MINIVLVISVIIIFGGITLDMVRVNLIKNKNKVVQEELDTVQVKIMNLNKQDAISRCKDSILKYMKHTQRDNKPVRIETKHEKFLRFAEIIEKLEDKEKLLRSGTIYGKKSLFVTQKRDIEFTILKKIIIDYENDKFLSIELDPSNKYDGLAGETRRAKKAFDVTDMLLNKWEEEIDIEARDVYMIDLGDCPGSHRLINYLTALALSTEYDNATSYYRGLLMCGDTSQILDRMHNRGKIYDGFEMINKHYKYECKYINKNNEYKEIVNSI